MSGARKPLLFHSERCPYSRSVRDMLEKAGASDAFNMVSVDRDRHQLPRFVTRVPTVLLAEERRMLQDEQVMAYVTEVIRKHKEAAGPADFEPAGFGNFASFDNYDVGGMGNDGFVSHVGGRDDAPFPSITGPFTNAMDPVFVGRTAASGGSDGGGMSGLEAMQQQRTQDAAMIQGKIPRPI